MMAAVTRTPPKAARRRGSQLLIMLAPRSARFLVRCNPARAFLALLALGVAVHLLPHAKELAEARVDAHDEPEEREPPLAAAEALVEPAAAVEAEQHRDDQLDADRPVAAHVLPAFPALAHALPRTAPKVRMVYHEGAAPPSVGRSEER